MITVTSDLIASACNRVSQAADWSISGHGVLVACNTWVAVYDPQHPSRRGILQTLRGHTGRVNCVRFLRRGSREVGVVSASADTTCRVWRLSAEGVWNTTAVLTGHTEPVTTVGVMRSPWAAGDVDIIASSSSDGTVRVWERTIGEGSEDSVVCTQVIDTGVRYPLAMALAYMPNSDVPVLVTGGTEKKIKLYCRTAGKFTQSLTLQGHTDWIRSIDIATFTGPAPGAAVGVAQTLKGFNHGDLIIASSSQDKYVRLWRVSENVTEGLEGLGEKADGREKTFDEALRMLESFVGLDGEMKLSTKAHKIEVDTAKEKKTYTAMFDAMLAGHDDWVHSVAWQPCKYLDGEKTFHQPLCLVSASADKSLLVWRPDQDGGVWVNESRLGEVGGNSAGFYGGIFSPDGRLILAHGYGGSVQVWGSASEDDKSWTPGIGISGHAASVEGLAWDVTGRYVVSVSLDQTSRLFGRWNRDGESTWHEVARPQIHGYDLHCIDFLGRYTFVSGADEKVLRIFDAPRTFVESWQMVSGFTESEAVLKERPVGASVPALGLSNKAIGTAETNIDDEFREKFVPIAPKTVSEPPSEQYLSQHTLWPETNKLYGHGYELVCVACSHDGTLIASASKATKPEYAGIRLWSTSTWKEVGPPLMAHSLTVTALAFSGDDTRLLSVGRDRMWSLFKKGDAGEYTLEVNNLTAHLRIIWGCSWSRNDTFFATASRDKTRSTLLGILGESGRKQHYRKA
ncbi:Elongator subunit elp2 [Irineochytrium annulatum]|nr:Elongator subunit elp2 [Irineochytrium annulatum]